MSPMVNAVLIDLVSDSFRQRAIRKTKRNTGLETQYRVDSIWQTSSSFCVFRQNFFLKNSERRVDSLLWEYPPVINGILTGSDKAQM
jgi:hypothetical protein